MKKILLFVLLTPFFGFSQIINIPDPALKAALLAQMWDANGDGEIDQSEAFAPALTISGPEISSLEGLQYITVSFSLTLTNTSVTAMDFSMMVGLEHLGVENNALLTSLNVSGMSTLTELDLEGNPLLTSVSLTGLTALNHYSAVSTALVTIDLSQCLNLLDVYMGNNQNIDVLNLSNLPLLNHVLATSNKINTVDISGSPLVTSLDLSLGYIGNLNASGLTALTNLNLGTTPSGVYPPSTVNLTNCSSLTYFSPVFANIGTIDLTGCSGLTHLNLNQNPLTAIDLSDCPNLTYLDVSDGLITTLDISMCPLLTSVETIGSPLETILAKNGTDNNLLLGPGASAIQFICADEIEIDDLQFQLDNAMSSGVVSSYCTFTPGGAYNTITGNLHYDLDNDGCDDADLALATMIGIEGGTNAGLALAVGDYIAYVGAGSHTLTPLLENPTYFQSSPVNAVVNFADVNYTNTVQDFCITANGVHPDVEVIISPVIPARPGFDAQYMVSLRNKGNVAVSGSANFTYQDDRLDFIASSPMPDNQTTGQLVYNYTNLQPFASTPIYITLNVNSPMETPAVNIDDALNFSAGINPVAGDEMPEDNTFGYNQIVVGSFDPNDKHCVEGDIVSTTQIGQYLHYIINFENTGTFEAENVVIKDLIDTEKFDISTLQVLGASHTQIPMITGNRVEFIFEGIDLQPNAYGYVAFKIKTKPSLPVNTTVTNKANIYFDFNFPIETNTASTTFQNLGVGENPIGVSIRLFPNPARQTVTIQSQATIRSVAIFDVQGREMLKRNFDQTSISVDVSALASGVYFIMTTTNSGIKTERLLKE